MTLNIHYNTIQFSYKDKYPYTENQLNQYQHIGNISIY